MWRRVAQADLERARATEYQIVATPVQKRAGVSSSFNTAHLYTVEVRTRRHQRDQRASADHDSGAYENGSASAVPSYARNLQMYTFGGGSNSAVASSVTRVYGGGGELERNPSSTCFTTLGNTAKVRRVCMRYIKPLRFTAGDAVATALHQANTASATASSAADGDETEKLTSLPLWEDGSIVRPGVLLCDRHDPCAFCYYAATLRRPWCTVLMDSFLVDDALLLDFIEHSRDSGSTAAVTCIDLAFRVEELPVVRNDPRNPSHTINPAQPVSIRIGVIEVSQLDAYRRGVQHIVREMVFFSPSDTANEGSEDAAQASGNSNDSGTDNRGDASAHNSAWGALDYGMGRKAQGGGDSGVSWSYTDGGGPILANDEDPNSAAAAEAEVTAWLQASVQESTQASRGGGGAEHPAAVPTRPLAFWSETPTSRSVQPTKGSAADPYTGHRKGAPVPRAGRADVPDDDGDEAYVLGDTPGSFGYDAEGGYISEASSYPLGSPLQKGDVVHLQFFHDEDVIVVMRNKERLGTLVADAFSEQQQWCVAVSLQNCGVRFIPPRLN